MFTRIRRFLVTSSWALALAGLALALGSVMSSLPVTFQTQELLAHDLPWTRALFEGEPHGSQLAAVSTDVGILVKYVGNEGSGSVAVDAATGDLTFTDGAEGAEAATDTFECPVSGGLGGVIDVSNAACNTLGEVVDAINGQSSGATGWRAVILDGLRADSSDNTLITLAATAATAQEGLGLLKDSTVALDVTRCMGCPRDISQYLASSSSTNPSLIPNPFTGTRTFFITGRATTTYGSGTSTFQVISAASKNNNSLGTQIGSETTETIYSLAGGATTAEAVFNAFQPYGLPCKKNERCLARVLNSAAMTAAVFSNTAAKYSYPK